MKRRSSSINRNTNIPQYCESRRSLFYLYLFDKNWILTKDIEPDIIIFSFCSQCENPHDLNSSRWNLSYHSALLFLTMETISLSLFIWLVFRDVLYEFSYGRNPTVTNILTDRVGQKLFISRDEYSITTIFYFKEYQADGMIKHTI